MKMKKVLKFDFSELSERDDDITITPTYVASQLAFEAIASEHEAKLADLKTDDIIEDEDEAIKIGIKLWQDREFLGCHNGRVKVEVLLVKDNGDFNDEEVVACSEIMDIHMYPKFAQTLNTYARHYDKEPQVKYYCSMYALECDLGWHYERNFIYFDCGYCGRTVCEQNPSNGWEIQFGFFGEEKVCLSCMAKEVLENGTPGVEDMIYDREERLIAIWCSEDELDEAGYTQAEEFYGLHTIGMGRKGFTDPDIFWEKMEELFEDGYFERFDVLLRYNARAIGGLGEDITVYSRPKKESAKNTDVIMISNPLSILIGNEEDSYTYTPKGNNLWNMFLYDENMTNFLGFNLVFFEGTESDARERVKHMLQWTQDKLQKKTGELGENHPTAQLYTNRLTLVTKLLNSVDIMKMTPAPITRKGIVSLI